MESALIVFASILFVAVLAWLIWRRVWTRPVRPPGVVILFDLSAIPSDATIVDATLRVNCGVVEVPSRLRPQLIVEYETQEVESKAEAGWEQA